MPDRLKIYLETSVISYLVAKPSSDPERAARQSCTRRCLERMADSCEFFVSDLVEREAREGDALAAELRIAEVAKYGRVQYDRLQADALAARLRTQHNVLSREEADAEHIAICSVSGIDVLLTWNCRHMANIVELPKTIGIIVRCGYECPRIVTPEDYMRNIYEVDHEYDDPIVREIHEFRYASARRVAANPPSSSLRSSEL